MSGYSKPFCGYSISVWLALVTKMVEWLFKAIVRSTVELSPDGTVPCYAPGKGNPVGAAFLCAQSDIHLGKLTSNPERIGRF